MSSDLRWKSGGEEVEEGTRAVEAGEVVDFFCSFLSFFFSLTEAMEEEGGGRRVKGKGRDKCR